MSSAEYSCKLFKPIFTYRQTVLTQIRLLLEEQSHLGPHCLQKWQNHQQMTKQTTIFVTGSLRVKRSILCAFSFLSKHQQLCWSSYYWFPSFHWVTHIGKELQIWLKLDFEQTKLVWEYGQTTHLRSLLFNKDSQMNLQCFKQTDKQMKLSKRAGYSGYNPMLPYFIHLPQQWPHDNHMCQYRGQIYF